MSDFKLLVNVSQLQARPLCTSSDIICLQIILYLYHYVQL